MLVLSRKILQSLYMNMSNSPELVNLFERMKPHLNEELRKDIDNYLEKKPNPIKLQVVGIGRSVKLGIEADSSVTILRDELVDGKKKEQSQVVLGN